LTAKQLDVRPSDYATSGKTVSIKSYDNTSTYDFVLPSTNPKYLNGVDGTEKGTDTVLTYDVVQDKYVWKESGGSSFFIQGETATIGADEHGNVLTVKAEQRLVEGDPGYDPTKAANEQEFKVEQEFTDNLYNIAKLAAGKQSLGGSIQYEKTTGMYFGYSGAAPGGSVDEQKQAKDKLLLTTQIAHSSQTAVQRSDIVLQPTGIDMQYKTDAGAASGVSVSDNSVVSTSQNKTLSSSNLVSTTLNAYPGLASNTATSLVQKATDLQLVFGADSSKGLTVDNAKKQLSTDMETIEFGASNNKHRLNVANGKLYIQKWDNGTSKWVGADTVIDSNAAYTATLTTPTVSVSGSDATVTATIGGTGGDHWYVFIDDNVAGAQTPNSGASQQFTGLYAGDHTVVAFVRDGSSNKVSEQVSATFTIA